MSRLGVSEDDFQHWLAVMYERLAELRREASPDRKLPYELASLSVVEDLVLSRAPSRDAGLEPATWPVIDRAARFFGKVLLARAHECHW